MDAVKLGVFIRQALLLLSGFGLFKNLNPEIINIIADNLGMVGSGALALGTVLYGLFRERKGAVVARANDIKAAELK